MSERLRRADRLQASWDTCTFFDGKSISLWEAEWQVHQFLATRSRVWSWESRKAPLEEMASIDVLATDLEGESDWDVAG